jgi:signal transduction histidine kinase
MTPAIPKSAFDPKLLHYLCASVCIRGHIPADILNSEAVTTGAQSMQRKAYFVLAALMIASALAALALSWTALGRQFNTYAYDFFFRLELPAPWQSDSIILAIDEETLTKYGGLTGMRTALSRGLEAIEGQHPAAIAVDLILPDASSSDGPLEAAFANAPKLILACDLLANGTWEDPIERFRKHAVAVGQVHADLDKFDAISRDLPLEKAAGHDRRWALALATFAAVKGAAIVESPEDLLVGSTRIPSTDADGRVMRIRYTPPSMNGIPRVSIAELDRQPELAARFAGKVVFAGVTAQTVSDRWMTPYSNSVAMPGIEFHANAYETLARGMFLVDAPLTQVAAFCFALAAAVGLAFAFTTGWITNLAAILLILASQAIPAFAFSRSVVWPWMPGTLAAVFATAAAAAWLHLIVRRQLFRAESEKARYQRSMQFAIHELRTPLTAIQGSSELISRYGAMPEAKRKQMADLINAESKRLARMIETFLSVEKLSAGQMEMKQERFALAEIATRCAERAAPLADAKKIALRLDGLPSAEIAGDRELMEYAVYNLLTNAIKYSPSGTDVRVFGNDDNGTVRLSVQDQGIGMDKKEVRRIFEKFYRTKRAEQSGEAGTGIGLSIVEQIIVQHGGSIHVESEPGRGSRFTLVLKR